jgi:acyl-CoA thioester hydrolase
MPTQPEKTDLTRKDAYRHWTCETVRYGDTDRQGHVNNAVFSTFLESGRVRIIYDPERPLAPEGASFVIARLVLDFRGEIRWPSEVAIGTVVLALGRSSVTLGQGLFVGDDCAATAETVIVMMDEATRKSRPLPDETRAALLA